MAQDGVIQMSVIKVKQDNEFVDIPSIQGPTGPQGQTGPSGQGVADGGTTGQVLVKNSSSDYDTSWKFVDTPCARFSQTSTIQVSKDGSYGGVQIPMNSMDYSFGNMFRLGSDGNCYYNGTTPAIIHFDSTFSCTCVVSILLSNTNSILTIPCIIFKFPVMSKIPLLDVILILNSTV